MALAEHEFDETKPQMTNKVDKEVSERLREARIKKYDSAENFVEAINAKLSSEGKPPVSLHTYRSHERGARSITKETAHLYAEFLSANPDWILYGKTLIKFNQDLLTNSMKLAEELFNEFENYREKHPEETVLGIKSALTGEIYSTLHKRNSGDDAKDSELSSDEKKKVIENVKKFITNKELNKYTTRAKN